MSAWTAAKSLRQTAGGERLWWVIDARGWRVGRLASYVSQLLQGKHKPTYHSALDCGDHVVVLHSEALQFSGNKWDEKMYRWHTGYMGGLKEVPAKRYRKTDPGYVLRSAVSGMLPKNRTRWVREDRLVCLTGDENPHESQTKKNGWRLALQTAAQRSKGTMPNMPGYFVKLTDEDEKLIVSAEPYLPEKMKEDQAEKARKLTLQKDLRDYIFGRGPRPESLSKKRVKREKSTKD